MNNRKNEDKRGTTLPEAWLTEVRGTFNKTYAPQCKSHNKSFDVHGETHPDELVLAISFFNAEKPELIPTTYLISADLSGKAPAQKMLDTLVDSAGVFFDQYFATPDWNEYFGEWTEAEVRGIEFFYIVNRENIRLSLMADQLLGSDGELS
tara:strand:+ start:247 stop:699 length:453 start_codon:yes stop_codon:yes gene_type:complete